MRRVDRSNPLVVFGRPTQEWISRVDQKQRQFADLKLSSEQQERAERWLEAEFVLATLKLEGTDINRGEVGRLVSRPSEDAAAANRDCLGLIKSVRMVRRLARDSGPAASLTPELLITIHENLTGSSGLRATAGAASPIRPVPPEHLPAAVEAACQWFSAESFAELHPVEQAAIVLLRLIEIQPFETAVERSALVAASLFTLRRGLPELIIKPEMLEAYRAALDEGTRMNTKPMVELIAEALEKSLAEIHQEATSR